MNRPLTKSEVELVSWLLQHGNMEAASFLPQLAEASVTPWRCLCGCASINFAIHDRPEPHGGMNILADFLFGSTQDLSGIFVFEQSGQLSGLEVYGLAGEAPKYLPAIDSLRPFESASSSA